MSEDRPLLWLLGDSWSDPNFGPPWGLDGWPHLLSERLGLGLVNAARGGAGYMHWNPEWIYATEAMRVPCPTADVALLFGSVNDLGEANNPLPPAEVGRWAERTIRLVQRTAPGADVIVAGPQTLWTSNPPAGLYRLVDAIEAAADRAGVLFVDTMPWTLGRPDLIGSDAHPNAAGQLELADRFEDVVGGMLASRALAGRPAPVPVDGALTFPVEFPLDFAGPGD